MALWQWVQPSMCPFWLQDNKRAAAKRRGVSVVPAGIMNKWKKKKWCDQASEVLRGSFVLLSRTGEGAGVQGCVWHKWRGLLQAALVAGAGHFRRNLSGLSPCKIKRLQVFSLKEKKLWSLKLHSACCFRVYFPEHGACSGTGWELPRTRCWQAAFIFITSS